MEIDFKLREFLINDQDIAEHEYKLLLKYFECKQKYCNVSNSEFYKNRNIKIEENTSDKTDNKFIDYISFKDYEDCNSYCSNDYITFNKVKKNFYKRFIDKLYSNKLGIDINANSNVYIKQFDDEFPLLKSNFMKYYA